MKKLLVIGLALMLINACKIQIVKQPSGPKPISMDKELFIQSVWDFEKEKNFKYIGNQPAIIDFYADWCGPCRRISPILDKIQSDYAGKVTVYKINTDYNKQLASLFKVRSIPAVLFIPLNSKPKMLVGVRAESEYISLTESMLPKKK